MISGASAEPIDKSPRNQPGCIILEISVFDHSISVDGLDYLQKANEATHLTATPNLCGKLDI